MKDTPNAVQFLAEENRRLVLAGNALAEAALRVTTEYDGVHRLRLAVAGWAQALADEGGRGKVPPRHHRLSNQAPANGEQ